MKKETKGVVICAWSHPFYGNYAAQLAASIKYTTDLPVTLLYTPSAVTHFTDVHKSFFSQMIEIPNECFFSNGIYQPFVSAYRSRSTSRTSGWHFGTSASPATGHSGWWP